METIVTGILLGGTYALIAIGLTLQYGVARIMNLANGETFVAACFIAFWLFTSYAVNPLWGILIIAPLAFVVNWAIYALLLRPLVDRAKNQGMLEVDSILATFGLLFLFQGLMLRGFGGAYTSYTFLSERFEIFGTFYGLNRVVAFVAACVIAVGALSLSLPHALRHRGARGRGQSEFGRIWSASTLRTPRRCRSRSAARSRPAAARCCRPSTRSMPRWASSSP